MPAEPASAPLASPAATPVPPPSPSTAPAPPSATPASSPSAPPRASATERSRARWRRPAPPWVLMYHSVADPAEDPYRITVSPARLDRQLNWLRGRGLRGVSVGELLTARSAGRGGGLVGLTFDDGYADFLDNALPLLRRHECTATLFVLPGRLGGDNEWDPLGPRKPLLTAAGIQAAARAGVEIGSHGMRHLSLPDADENALRTEVSDSRAALAGITGRHPEGYCYAYGTVDQRAIEAVRGAGYRYACAIDPGPLTGRYALPRAHIGENDAGWRLHLKRRLHPLRRRPLRTEPPSSAGPASTPAARAAHTFPSAAPGTTGGRRG
ncbi:polysaccharide deacetylase family protein [Streptomyces axinellae]|uniref:NodB homology domain-containing protein n=1 Tax=Streptomyces axinellae TaxID=552788 RepID=A0ABN3Q2B5_9ACTN